jgi:hypothetical protein
MVEALFIGGCADGQRITIDEWRTAYYVPVPVPIQMNFHREPTFDQQRCEQHRYRLSRFDAGDNGLLICWYIYDGMSERESLEALLEHYHPKDDRVEQLKTDLLYSQQQAMKFSVENFRLNLRVQQLDGALRKEFNASVGNNMKDPPCQTEPK